MPKLPANLVPNVIGLLGLAALCVAVGALTDWRWALGLGGLMCVGLAWLWQTAATPPAAAPAKRSAHRKATS